MSDENFPEVPKKETKKYLFYAVAIASTVLILAGAYFLLRLFASGGAYCMV